MASSAPKPKLWRINGGTAVVRRSSRGGWTMELRGRGMDKAIQVDIDGKSYLFRAGPGFSIGDYRTLKACRSYANRFLRQQLVT